MPKYWQDVAGEAGTVHSFWQAAKELSDLAEVSRSDALFLPVAFLWRHAAELALKRGIRWLADEVEGDGPSEDEVDALEGHQLLELWDHWRVRQQRVHADWSEKDVRRARSELARLSQLELNPSGFRYSTLLDGTPVPRPDQVDIAKFADTLDLVVGVVMYLEDELEEMLQAQRELGP